MMSEAINSRSILFQNLFGITNRKSLAILCTPTVSTNVPIYSQLLGHGLSVSGLCPWMRSYSSLTSLPNISMGAPVRYNV